MALITDLPRKDPIDIAERKLWCAVIRQALEIKDRRFFRERGGIFSQVCELMNLPEDEIRQQVCL